MHRPRERINRLAYFLTVTLANLALFALLYHLTVFVGWMPAQQKPTFQMVGTMPPPSPPHPALASDSGGHLADVPLPPSSLPPPPIVAASITTANASAFTVPETKLPSRENLPTSIFNVLHGGSSQGLGNDTGHGSDEHELYGAPINPTERALVIMDVSGSMSQFDEGARDRVNTSFRNSHIQEATDCRGAVLPEDKSNETGDLYLQTYLACQSNSFYDCVVIFTDFEDGDDPPATDAYIHFLQDHRLKLIIFSLEKTPYGHLADYAQQSGGGVYNLRPDQQPLTPQGTPFPFMP